MPDAFLDSSAVIGLLFRHAGEREACSAAIPEGAVRVCSRYVRYEVARGFLLSLIALYNFSFEYASYADLHLAAHSGQRRFKPYEMHTWLGAFDDFEAALEEEDEALVPSQKLEILRAKLRQWIRRGWSRLERDFEVRIDGIGCRDPLPAPFVRGDDRMDQALAVDRCGVVTACGAMAFVQRRRTEIGVVAEGLGKLPRSQRDLETEKRIEALKTLAAADPHSDFTGRHCHRSGDAFIALEASCTDTLVTKNAKHFEPIAKMLGKRVSVVVSANSARPSSGRS